jgi:hypothetical protein
MTAEAALEQARSAAVLQRDLGACSEVLRAGVDEGQPADGATRSELMIDTGKDQVT